MPMVQQRPGIRRVARVPEGGRPLSPDTGKALAPDEYDIHWKIGSAEHLIGQTRRVSEGKNGSWRPLPAAMPGGAAWPEPCRTHTLAIEELCKAWEATHPEGTQPPPAPPEAGDGVQEPAQAESAQAEPAPRTRKPRARKAAAAEQPLEGGVQEQIPGIEPPAPEGTSEIAGGEEEFAPGTEPTGPLPPLPPEAHTEAGAVLEEQTWTPEPVLSDLLGPTELVSVGTEHVVPPEEIPEVSDDALAAFLTPPAEVPLPPPAQAAPPAPSVLPPPAHPPVPPSEFGWDDQQPPPVPAVPPAGAPVPQADWLAAPPAAPGTTVPTDAAEDLFPYA